jgi:hypothetical protein
MHVFLLCGLASLLTPPMIGYHLVNESCGFIDDE